MTIRRTILGSLAVVLAVLPFAALLAPRVALAKGESSPPFVVRPDGAYGELVAYDLADGTERFRLPPGMLAADASRFYATTADGVVSWLETYNATTGRVIAVDAIDGDWEVGGVSPTGRWVALTRLADAAERRQREETGRWQTDLLIVDGDDGRVAHTIALDGNFEVETISAAGDALFLVQHLPAADPDRYLVRLYDLPTASLQEGALRDKRFLDEIMTGLAWDGLGSPDGRWLLTLYVNTQRDRAFVHTLDLVEKFAVCLDLPSGTGDPALLAAYSLTLAPDGRRAYATNPALGVVAEIDLAARSVARTARFDPSPPATDAPAPPPAGVVTADGRTLYFTDGRAVWAYDTRAARATPLLDFPSPILGLTVGPAGDRLYAADPAGAIAAIDPASGTLLAPLPARGADRR